MIDIYRNELRDLESARRWKARVHDWIWTEPNRFREIASKLAQDENNDLIAMGIYESLLLLEPESFEVLRFLGRISENMGKRERAYSYYSAILSVSADDNEAKGYLQTHRKSRSWKGTSSLNLSDFQLICGKDAYPDIGLLADSGESELCQFVFGLVRKSIGERDMLEPVEPIAQGISFANDILMSEGGVPIYLWRAGTYEVRAICGDDRRILLGATSYREPELGRVLFLAGRAIALNRLKRGYLQGITSRDLHNALHTLAGLISGQLESEEDVVVQDWLGRLRGVYEQTHPQDLIDSANRFLEVISLDDVRKWIRQELSRANKLSLVFTGDIEEAKQALKLYYDSARVEDSDVMLEAELEAEMADLVRFGTSELYYDIRENIGCHLTK
ncbi:MAG: hypothetical protein VYA34_12185 [Myxococcota bacterium]|nr:hypothetical protein [Myxococcota bacterium]